MIFGQTRYCDHTREKEGKTHHGAGEIENSHTRIV